MSETDPIYSAIEDKKTVHRDIERKREWMHGSEGLPNCTRKEKPVYTDVNKLPHECHGYGCDNTEYYSKGVVRRLKETKEIVHREKD